MVLYLCLMTVESEWISAKIALFNQTAGLLFLTAFYTQQQIIHEEWIVKTLSNLTNQHTLKETGKQTNAWALKHTWMGVHYTFILYHQQYGDC